MHLLETETFEADCTVEEVEKWVRCLEQMALGTSEDSKATKEKATAKQSSTITPNLFSNGDKSNQRKNCTRYKILLACFLLINPPLTLPDLGVEPTPPKVFPR